MNIQFIVAGGIFLVIAGLAGADLIATTINTDGFASLSTSGSDGNGSWASQAMGVDQTELVRSISGEKGLTSTLSIHGIGPVLFSEYAEALERAENTASHCVFQGSLDDDTFGLASMYTSGILKNGMYDITRSQDSGLSGESSINGSGLLLLGSKSNANQTLSSHGFVAGNMTVRDIVRYGGRL
jgi:hypothetical protein